MPVSFEVLLSFVAASLVVLVIPGPTILMVVSQALAHGRRVAFASVLGVGLGDLASASLSLAGVGTLLSASSTAFMLLKTVGALYLIYIGIALWRQPGFDMERAAAATRMEASRWRIFRDSFLVTLFNPKGIVFFTAFVPQFLSAERPFAPQAVLFVGLFALLGIINATVYMRLADRARDVVRRPRVLRAVTRTGAGLLVGAGLASLLARRPA